MSLAVGTRLGPYEVLAPVGAGGMGEVYRARDTRLGRDVAIKVLLSHLSHAELRQRFEREARAISALQHPHICTLYDIGEEDGATFLVMEYLEGETLDARLAKGAMPINQVLKTGTEIAEALDKAHRHGLIHRDLKPANIMITKSGAKLMDFGLAKTIDPSPTPLALSAMATADQPLTEAGVIVGTFQYMAPEQLEGRRVDGRGDIFALGAVLYQMATGKPAFTGKTRASVIAAILSSEPPPISSVQPLTPPAFDRVVKTCLAKDPDERWQSAHDLANELKWIAEGGSLAGVAAPVVARRKLREGVAWSVVAVLTLALAALLIPYLRRAPSPPIVVRFTVPFPENTAAPQLALPTLSPNGRSLAFVAEKVLGRPQLWVRSLDSLAVRELPGTEGATYAYFWSSDGQWVGFFVADKLKRVFLSGGGVETLCSGIPPDPYTAEANARGTVLLFFWNQPIHRLSLDDCSLKPATRLDGSANEIGHGHPHFLPDGEHFLFTSIAADRRHRVMLASLESMEAKPLLLNAGDAYFVEPGYIMFARMGNLLAQPFDLNSLRPFGQAFPAAPEKARFAAPAGYADYSASRNGVLAYQPEPSLGGALAWTDRTGKRLEAIPGGQSLSGARLSPEGDRIVAVRYDPESHVGDVWLYDLRGNAWTRVSSHGEVSGVVWSPNGQQVVYRAITEPAHTVFRRPAGLEGDEEVLLKSKEDITPTDISPNGTLLLYQVAGTTIPTDLMLLPLVGEHKPQAFLSSPYAVMDGHFSPDGQWVAYASGETGRPEIYLRPLSGPLPKLRVSYDGGTWPVWRRDGKELFYLSPDKRIMSVAVQLGPVPKTGSPQALFSAHKETTDFDVTADGKRFLLNHPSEASQGALPIRVVVNWLAEMKSK